MRKILFIISLFLWTCGSGSTEPEPPQLPTVQNINLIGIEDTPKVFTFVGTDPLNLALSYSISTQPQHGTVVISGASGTYTPNANYNGQDTFLYLASTVNGNSNIGTVLIDIVPVDDEPNTMDVNVTTDEDNAVTMTLEAEEVDGQTIQFNVTGGPSNGSITISGTTATYTPSQDWFGTDTFNFEATDVTSKSILNNATGTITVNPINDAPTVDDINNIEVSNGQSVNITLTGSDVENDNLAFEIVDSPNNGTVSISDNIVTFNAIMTGSDTFTYKATDGTDDSNIGTVTLNILETDSFEKTFGRQGDDGALSGLETSDGGYILAGYISYGNNDYNVFIVKTDAGGIEEWSVEYNHGGGNDGNHKIRSIKETSDGGYIAFGELMTAGAEEPGMIKIDHAGNIEWTKRGDEVETSLMAGVGYIKDGLEALDGGYVFISSFDPNVSGVTIPSIAKIDSDGQSNSENEWVKSYSENLNFRSIIESNNGYIVSGFSSNGSCNNAKTIIKMDSAGDEEWIKYYDSSWDNSLGSFNQIKETSDGGYITIGKILPINNTTECESDGNNRILLLKTDSEGNFEWTQTFDTGGRWDNTEGTSVDLTDDGGYILAYISKFGDNGSDISIIKLDSSGNQEWGKIFSGDEDDIPHEVHQTSDGGYMIVGATYSYGAGNSDLFLIKTDSEGNRIF